MSFSELGLSDAVLNAIGDAGYLTPTPIQTQAIPVVLTGRDVLGCAQTGTGKTASFVLPMIEMLSAGRARARMPRSIIMEPTRELAAQVAENFEKYGKYHRLNTALLIGGESFGDQLKALDRGVDVLIATPGRLLDLFERGKIILNDVKILVIDEADRMLDMGFIPDIQRIVSLLPAIRQTLFFSATMPPEIRALADAFLSNPKEISVAPPASPAATVEQHISVVEAEDKRAALRALIRAEDVQNAIVFCNRKRDVDILHKSLVRHGFDAAALHGDMVQSKRTETLDKFRRNEVKLLIASDVAARGLDIVGVSHVFNFDVPIHAEDYIHRIGRTGRAGRSGRAFTIAGPEDGRFVAAIEKMLGRPIPLIVVPDVEPAELLPDEEGGRRRRGRTGAVKKVAARPKREAAGRGARPRRERQPKEDVVEAVQPVTEDAAARPSRPRRERRPAAPREEQRPGAEIAVFDPSRSRRPRPEPQQDAEIDDSHAFGDHVPAFMLRTPRRNVG